MSPSSRRLGAVHARSIALAGGRGPVFGPVSFALPVGRLAAVVGPQGSGRTSLLLCSTARMRTDAGELLVLGERVPHHLGRVQADTALAGFARIDDLDEGLTVGELCTERMGLLLPLWRRVPRMDDELLTELLGPAFGGDPVPAARAQVWELVALERLRLRIGLALFGRPQLLAVDDVDVSLPDPQDQARLWGTLDRLRGPRLTIIAAATTSQGVPEHAVRVDLGGDAVPASRRVTEVTR